jgi:hypothetical protein
MTCREFEDAMLVVFADADPEPWRDRIVREHWDDLPNSEHYSHVKDCNDCQTSLWWFLDIRNRVDYLSQPCFHVAYFSADIADRCLDRTLGMYSVATMDKSGNGIVIAVCPWCGVKLQTSAK